MSRRVSSFGRVVRLGWPWWWLPAWLREALFAVLVIGGGVALGVVVAVALLIWWGL